MFWSQGFAGQTVGLKGQVERLRRPDVTERSSGLIELLTGLWAGGCYSVFRLSCVS